MRETRKEFAQNIEISKTAFPCFLAYDARKVSMSR